MSMMYQGTARVPDFERLRSALDWLHDEIEVPRALIRFRVFRDQQDPQRITILEEWESTEAFLAAYEQYSQTTREEFGRRAGVDLDAFERTLWDLSDIEEIVGAGR